MKRFVVFLLYIHVFCQVDSYVVEVYSLSGLSNNDVDVKKGEKFKDEDGVEVQKYKITFKQRIKEDSDIPLAFDYFDAEYEGLFSGNTTFCSADLKDDLKGTVAAIIAQAWGVEDEPVCPIQDNSYESNSVFDLPEANFGDFAPESGFIALEVNQQDSELLGAFLIYDDQGWENKLKGS